MRQAAFLAFLLALGFTLYNSVLTIAPFEEDNVQILAWAAGTPATGVVKANPWLYPQWRPLPYSTVWLQQRATADNIGAQFATNLLLWLGCAALAYVVARRLTPSAIGAMLAAVVVATDPRATWALVAIEERQSSLACLFGFGAMLWIMRRPGPLTMGDRWILGALLLASMLSKEYGAAFGFAAIAYGFSTRRTDLVAPVLGSAAIYVAARWLVVGFASAPYCEEMAYFNVTREVCLTASDPQSIPQMLYNVGATLVNLPLLGLVSPVGQPVLAESRLVTGLVLTGLAVVAIRSGPKEARLLLLVAIGNALLSAMIYRERNQVLGGCALAILAGAGVQPVLDRIGPGVRRTALTAAIAGVLMTQALLARALVVERKALAERIDPCSLDAMQESFMPPYVKSLKARYRLPDPACSQR